MINRYYKHTFNRGFSTIYALVVVGGLFLALLFSTTESSVMSYRYSNSYVDDQRTQKLLDSCMELALLQLHKDQSNLNAGSYENTLDQECFYNLDKAEGKYEITAQSLNSQIKAIVEVGDYININSWQSIDN